MDGLLGWMLRGWQQDGVHELRSEGKGGAYSVIVRYEHRHERGMALILLFSSQVNGES